MTKRRKAIDANEPDGAGDILKGVDIDDEVRETEVAEVEMPREAGTSNPVEAAQRSEVRKDGSIAYFSSEAAAAGTIREVGS